MTRSQPAKSARPVKGEVYRHAMLRGDWTIKSAGPKLVVLKSSIPYLKDSRIPTEGFLKANWERVR